MKSILNRLQLLTGCLLMIFIPLLFTACSKKLEPEIYGSLSETNFYKTANDAKAAVNAAYPGLMSAWGSGWGSAQGSFSTQAGQTTDEAVCNWDDGGSWKALNRLEFTPDFGSVTGHYSRLIQYISQITVSLSKIPGISMDASLQAQYIGELKALRAYYMQILYLYYGPVPARLNADEVNNPNAPVLARPTKEEMIGYIEKDFKDAIAVLPDKFTGDNYGRFSKAACYTSLMKLYMQEKRWSDAINAGKAVQAMGYSLEPQYGDLFNINNKNTDPREIILAIVCSPTGGDYVNIYRPHYLPSDYYDTTGGNSYQWGGYRMPWKTYHKFDPSDYRLKYVLKVYPTSATTHKDAEAAGDIGAAMIKYGPDPSDADQQNSGVNYVVMRYADVELLLAEALNEQNNGPTQEALNLLNDVHVTHGKLPPYSITAFNNGTFRTAIQNERLFELWAEGVRRDDLIRWGMYIQRAKDDGFNVDEHVLLYPLPRNVVNQSNGIIKQNPGYN
ncbi:RagB/SusD family nutrient uptake outer membrane protein [Danxiaibacter flavus]|uniref:RagB/SusD family nutrient uptake outer membrane protein n=1 Tax=Danxiaibacter flavus TaxID=3049108 RepID=A0ABV3ZAD6_9BACT|nr:RagB/SusD family nutrient uptake outer membrane protein [Chitinophagaceae bacterium DXS]